MACGTRLSSAPHAVDAASRFLDGAGGCDFPARRRRCGKDPPPSTISPRRGWKRSSPSTVTAWRVWKQCAVLSDFLELQGASSPRATKVVNRAVVAAEDYLSQGRYSAAAVAASGGVDGGTQPGPASRAASFSRTSGGVAGGTQSGRGSSGSTTVHSVGSIKPASSSAFS